MKLDYKKTLKVGTAFAIIMVFWTSYDYVVPLLLENAFGLSNSMRGLIMGLDNLLSLFMLPLFGKLSDKLVSKYGKRTPFIVVGTVVTVLLMVFVPISATKQLDKAMELRGRITDTFAEQYSYTAGDGTHYDSAEAIYTMLYEKGADNSDFCDRDYLKANGRDSLGEYLEIALNGKTDDGFSDDYIRFVKTGITNYANGQVYENITKNNTATLVVYMIILFFVLVAMATFRSPAIALMPDVTPKPLRSQANAMITLMGGVGGAIAFIIYTVALTVNPTAYVLVFGLVAAAMALLLVAYLKLVKENKLAAECEELCEKYGIDNDDDDSAPVNAETDAAKTANGGKDSKTAGREGLKKAKMTSFLLILASIFMWFMGYNAVQSNLSIYLTKTLGLGAEMGGLVSGLSMGVSAIAFIPVGMLAVKIGRKKSIVIGFALAVVSFVMVFFFAAHAGGGVSVLFTVFYLLAGFGLIISNVNTFPMVVELSTKDKVGRYTGFYYTATMSAQAITPFIAGLVMDSTGGSKYLFLYSAACVVVAIVLMMFVRHGDGKPVPPKSKLEMIGGD
ncbi:MAG: MFS transporter [Clostridiales bacterium]|jgi:MFS family permease|nr:MFS transporter [Clostridiales bacterium]